MKINLTLLALLLAVIFSSCKEKKAETTAQQVEPRIVEEKVEPVVEEEVKKEEPKAKYFLVAGCFEFKENALRLNAALLDEGYHSEIVPYYDMHLVTYEGYQTREEAQVALNKIILIGDKDVTWVYPVK